MTHYTRSADSLVSILNRGFLLLPNPRSIRDLFSDSRLDTHEPQSFGMVCFTELDPGEAECFREYFGSFGLQMSFDWAVSKNADRVLYLDDSGPVYENLKKAFLSARRELEKLYADANNAELQMALTNANYAGVLGASTYSSLLKLYEFVQTAEHIEEAEWRIVQSLPYYFRGEKPEERLQQAIEDSETWKVCNVQFSPADVLRFVTAPGDSANLKASLPPEYQHHEILEQS